MWGERSWESSVDGRLDDFHWLRRRVEERTVRSVSRNDRHRALHFSSAFELDVLALFQRSAEFGVLCLRELL